MVYAYDLWAQMPVKDLYDSLMMATAIAAAKDRYDKSYEQMKNFRNEYGDFMSPFAKDMEVYGKMVGGVHDLIDNALANGVDLYKSPEGRALIGRAINMVDPGLFNRMRANAKAGYAYLDAMLALKKAGKYSQEQEDFDIEKSGETPFDLFSSLGGAMWGRTSPIEATSLTDLTRKNYEHRTPRLLTKEDFNDKRLKGYKYNPGYEYTGYLYSDLMKVAPGASASLKGDPRAAFFRNEAAKKVAASGEVLTEENIEKQFRKDIADANAWALIDPTRKVNEYALKKFESDLDVDAYIRKKGFGGDDSNEVHKIFREAEARALYNGKASRSVGYVPNEAYYQWIDPVNHLIERVETDKGHVAFRIRNNQLLGGNRGAIYTENSLNSTNTDVKPAAVKNIGNRDAIFEQTGVFRCKKDKGGKYRYYIGGNLIIDEFDAEGNVKKDANGNSVKTAVTDKNTKDKTFYIEVSERKYNYAKKQAGEY